ncbi:MAG: hypothetical protein K6G51_02700 [Sphaerochaetaceae bacterium]|nr:hypothetical protein [Sphaerochaetaceae bacterium]
MKKKCFLITMIILIVAETSFAKDFDRFELNIATTIVDTLGKRNSNVFGVDYTILGFDIERNSTGFIFRFGAQAPRTSLNSFFTVNAWAYSLEKQNNIDESITSELTDSNFDTTTTSGLNITNTNEPESNEEKNAKNKEKDWSFNRNFKFAIMMGPAIRHRFNESVSFYTSLGPRINIEAHNYGNFSENTTYSHRDIKIALDLDAGFWIILKDRITCRIGLHGYYNIATLDHIVTVKNGEKESHLINFLFTERMYHLNAVGYIAFSRTFKF